MVEHIPTDRNDAQDPAQTDRPLAAEAKPVAPTARRRLLRTGLIGGPVALLTAGKPVKTLASTYCSMSGWNSINISDKKKSKKTLSHTPATGTCTTGKPPSSWVKKSGSKTFPTAGRPRSTGIRSTPRTERRCSALCLAARRTACKVTACSTILSSHSSTVEAYIIAAAFSSETVSGFISPSQVATTWSTWGSNTVDGSTTDAVALLSFLQQLV